MTYTVKDFIIENNCIYVNLILQDKNIFKIMHISINGGVKLNELPNKYGVVTNAHIIDNQGVGIYEPRKWRPLIPLPEGIRECKQWEFDRHWSENPDLRLTVDINALIWIEFNKLQL